MQGGPPRLGRVARARQPCDARPQRARAQLRPDAGGGRAAERTGRPLRGGAVLSDGELADGVRAGRVGVRLRRREGQPARRAAHVRERLVDRGARQRACALDVRALRAVLAQQQRPVGGVAALSRLTAEQVEDALEVDLHRGHGDLIPVLEVVAHLGEEVADHAVRHALVRRPQAGGLADRVRLARARLPVGYQRAIVAEEGRANERPADRLEELRVVLLAAEDRGKTELLPAATNRAACCVDAQDAFAPTVSSGIQRPHADRDDRVLRAVAVILAVSRWVRAAGHGLALTWFCPASAGSAQPARAGAHCEKTIYANTAPS